MALKLKLVRGRSYETYNSKEVKKEHNKKAKADEEETVEEEATIPLVTHVNNILHSIFSNVEVYINNQQIFNCNTLYAHKSYISNNFKRAVSEYKCTARVRTMKNFLMKLWKRLCLNLFFTKRMKMFSTLDGFMLYGKWELTLSPLLKCYFQI